MVNFTVKSLLVFLLIFACTVSARIYRGIDADGNVFYTDQPSVDAVEYTPSTISVIDSSKARPEKETADKEPVEFKYTKFDIVSPIQNQVIRNESDISISLQIAPPLNLEQGHNVWLLVDGKPVVKNSQSMSLQIGRLDRGAHKFQAQVRDSSRKIVARTRTTIAHVKYNSR